MQLIFQSPFAALNPKMTVGAAVAEPLLLHTSLPRAQRLTRAAEILSQVGIRPDQMSRYPHQMSGGQLARVGIARALVMKPDLLVCDEPTASLDMSIQGQALNTLIELQRSSGVGYLFISHDLALVRGFADRVIVLYAGRVVEEGPADSLFAAPRHPYTRMLVNATPSADPANRHLLSDTVRVVRDGHDGDWVGCAFYRRCPRALDECRAQTPQLGDAVSRHRFRCHNPEPQAEAAPPRSALPPLMTSAALRRRSGTRRSKPA
jgi:oligopeptide/dipeptide ABC transporter ATP-binding protein